MSHALSGKTILFLGSSVVYGSAASGYSFVEALAERTGLIPVKEAVSGTTLVNDSNNAYIARLRQLSADIPARAFLCQLSTNDASRGKPLGEISPSFDPKDFDEHTITGALEIIIAYARDTWHCPVLFFTGTRYDSPAYAAMVERLLALKGKWPIHVLDLWNDPDMNAISPEDYQQYMKDPIHPTSEGYALWWAPKFEAFLTQHCN